MRAPDKVFVRFPGLACLLFVLSIAECPAAEPTLARLSFRVPPERMAEFESVYRAKVAPMLKRHSLSESSRQGRATVDSVFSRLFELKTPAEIDRKEEALRGDPAWTALLQELGATYGTFARNGWIRYAFQFYLGPAGNGVRTSAGSGRTVPAGPGKGHWQIYDRETGLEGTGSDVRAIFQDREGFLWFGTAGGGVSRFDGQSFTTFSTEDGLASNNVRTILQDPKGHLWFGTAGSGVSRFDGQSFATFTTENGLASNHVRAVIQDRKGDLWFGTLFGGASRYDGQTFTTFTTENGLAGNDVWSILEDRDGYLWFGTIPGGATRYDGKAFTAFTTENGLAHSSVQSLLQGRKGDLWFGTYGGGVSRYDGRTWTTFTTEDGLTSNRVPTITQDREGNLWFGSWGSGVSRYDGRTWTTFTTEDGLTSNRVPTITQDREGNLWFGTTAGMNRYDPAFAAFTTENGLANDGVWAMLQDREGNLWFGTAGGVSRYDGQIFTTFTTEDGLAHNEVQSILQDRKGDLWFGTRGGGVSRYDGGMGDTTRTIHRIVLPRPPLVNHPGRGTFTTFTTENGLTSNDVRCIFQDRDGNLWFGSWRSGVSRYDGRTWATFTTEDGLSNNGVYSIVQDRAGDLWFATAGGVSRHDGQSWTTFTMEKGLAHNEVLSILQDREGNLWFATHGGVSRYDGQTFTTLSARDGLVSNDCRAVIQDSKGDFWIGTFGGGVSRYDGRVIQSLTRQDGLVGNAVHCMLQDRDGDLWIGTTQGLTRYRPPAPSAPPVLIEGVVADRRYRDVSEVTAPSTVRLTAFEFRSRSFKTRPEAMVYRYHLKGYDEEWKTTHERRVEYQDLPRGTYTFEVQAVDRDLVYSEKPATLLLTVHPPYEWIGLMSALGISILLIGWQTVRVIRRDQRLQDANIRLQELDELKTDFFSNVSHELRTPMTAIKGYIDNMLDGIAGTLNEKQDRYLTRVKSNADRLTRLINDLLDLSRIDRGRTDLLQVHIETVPVREVILEAVEGMRPMAESAGLTLRFEGEEVSVRADRDRLVQLVTNLVGNGVKFTPAGGEISVTVKSDGSGYVQTAVRDTGKGIAAEDLDQIFDRFYQVRGEGSRGGTGLGLPITKELVELQDGQIWVESEVGVGSIFTFTLPEARS